MTYFRSLIYSCLFTLCLVYSQAAQAQNTLRRWQAGLNIGGTQAIAGNNGNKTKGNDLAAAISLDWYAFPFLSLGTAIQGGGLRGKVPPGEPENGGKQIGEAYKNQYLSLHFNGKLHLGGLILPRYGDSFTRSLLRGVYIGSGLGLIRNKVRISDSTHTNLEIVMPLHFGIDYTFKRRYENRRLGINLDYQFVPFLDNGIDGQSPIIGKDIGRYHFLSVGIRYNFGTERYFR